jgi:nucleoside-diphosphate-sugar epimerase
MRIGITGHSDFLGKGLFDLLGKNHEVIGFSRSNGYDLKNYKNILTDVVDLDVFINNTYHPNLQQKIFEELFDLWKEKDKTIFNVLTSAIFNNGSFDDYRESKLNLQTSTLKLINSNLDKKVRVINLYPNTLEHNKRVGFNKVNFSEVHNIIEFQLNLPQSLEMTHICVSRTTVLKDKILI